MPRLKIKPSKTYKKVITKRSGKTKVKAISEKKYKRKLKRAVKSEARGKRKKVTGTTTTTTGRPYSLNVTTKRQTISKKKDKGRKKTFVGTTKKGATVSEIKKARLKKKRR